VTTGDDKGFWGLQEEVVDRFLAGEASAEERARVAAWLARDPARGELLAALRAGGDPAAEEDWDVDAAWRRVRARMDGSSAAVQPGAPRPSRVGGSEDDASVMGARAATSTSHAGLPPRRPLAAGPRVLRWAAVLIVAAAGVWTAVQVGARGDVVVATAVGERREVTLPDGSHVRLAPASTLRYPRDFGRVERGVVLEGEAFFDVEHDAGHPFRVRARGTLTEVLGTRFDVSAYADGGTPRVRVLSGRVRFVAGPDATGPDGAAGVILEAGQEARAERAGRIEVDVAPGEAVEALARDRIVLVDVPLAEALRHLERWFGVRFRLEAIDPATRIELRTPASPSLRDTAEGLGVLLGARVEVRGDTVVVHGGSVP